MVDLKVDLKDPPMVHLLVTWLVGELVGELVDGSLMVDPMAYLRVPGLLVNLMEG